jgi:hypothetical protein
MADEITAPSILEKYRQSGRCDWLYCIDALKAMEEYFQLKYQQKIEEAGKGLPTQEDIDKNFPTTGLNKIWFEKRLNNQVGAEWYMKQALPIIAELKDEISKKDYQLLHQIGLVKERTKQLNDSEQQLQAKNVEAKELRVWKDEAIKLYSPLIDYGQNEMNLEVGESIVDKILERLKSQQQEAIFPSDKEVKEYIDKSHYNTDSIPCTMDVVKWLRSELKSPASSDAVQLLMELYRLKCIKDNAGKTLEYQELQPKIWHRVKKFLNGK